MNFSYVILDGEEIHLEKVHLLIKELAVFEKEPFAVSNTLSQFTADFNTNQFGFKVVLSNEAVIGFALYYTRYSTWKGRCLYLEDFYIQPAYRSHGIGTKMFKTLIDFGKSEGYIYMNWQVLDWNKEAIKFYENIGATIDKTWYNGTISLI